MTQNSVKFVVQGSADLDVKNLVANTTKAQKSLEQLKLPAHLQDSFSNLFSKLFSQIDDFQNKTANTFQSMGDVKAAEKSFASLENLVASLQSKMDGLDLSKLSLKDTNKVAVGLKKIDSQLKIFKTQSNEAEKAVNALKKGMSTDLKAKINTDELIRAVHDGDDLMNTFKQLRRQNTVEFKVKAEDIEEAKEDVKHLEEELATFKGLQASYRTQKGGGGLDSTQYLEASALVNEYTESLKLAKIASVDLQAKQEQFEVNAQGINKIQEAMKKLTTQTKEGNLDGVAESIKEIEQEATRLSGEGAKQLAQELEQAQSAARGLGDEMSGKVAPAVSELGSAAREVSEMEVQMDRLKRQMIDFFSISNGWNIVRNIMRSAFETVKDLDAQMTEIAVVTTMSLDEVWSKRGKYSKDATAMGAETLDMVAASKLYYQQGLNEIQVNEAATETIKMARIANLDGAKATDLMTAAVRGFNMEMSEASHINDVYSQLAAKTASDTLEIAEAMTRTASIANAAGSSFDNTAAFLTQMIETTREAPENLGTALKTIIARFQEMKKAPEDIGEIDGEIVDANKIETALRTVDIALRNTKGEFRDFDDVILDISAKWDTMDKMTQRYIATTAAGSRQQSRFIALVQNNARLIELTGYAANSAGASNEQFEKTLDSLQSRLNKMSNALDLFWTNLLDSVVIKGAIDLFTGLLDVINGLMSVLPGFTKSLVGVLLGIAAFQGAGKLINVFFTQFAKVLTLTSGGVATLGAAVPKLSKVGTVFAGLVKVFSKVKSLFAVFAIPGLGPVLAGVIALSAGLVVLYNVTKKWTLADQMEKAKKATKAAEEAAARANDAYTDLLTGKGRYNDLQTTLEQLTKGTNEWRKALIDSNSEVLNLLTTYPKLSKYLQTGEQGQLSFLSEGWQELARIQEEALKNTNTATMVAKINEEEFKPLEAREVFKQNFTHEFMNELSTRDIPMIKEDAHDSVQYEDPMVIRDMLLAAYEIDAEGLLERSQNGEYSEAFKAIDAVTAIKPEFLYSVVAEYDKAIKLSKIVTDSFSASLLSMNIDQSVKDSKFGESIVSGTSRGIMSTGTLDYESRLTKGVDELSQKKGGTSTDELIRRLNEKGISDTGDQLKNLQLLYAELSGLGSNIEGIPKEIRDSEVDLAKAIKVYDLGDEISKNAKELADRSKGLDNVWGPVFSAIFSPEAITRSMTQSTGFLTKEELAPNLQSIAKLLGLGEGLTGMAGLADLLEYAGDTDIEKVQKMVNDLQSKMIQDVDNLTEAENNLVATSGLKDRDFTDISNYEGLNDLANGQTAGSINLLSKVMEQVFNSQGKDAAAEMSKSLISGLESMTDDQIATVIKQLSMTDLTDLDSLDAFQDLLGDMGIIIQDSLIKKIGDLNNAIREISVEDLTKKVSGVAKIISDIGDSSRSSTFSAAEYGSIVEVAPELAPQFTPDLEGGYVFIGSSMEGLSSALAANTSALVSQNLNILKTRIATGETASAMDIPLPSPTNLDEQKAFLKAFQLTQASQNDSIISKDADVGSFSESAIANMIAIILSRVSEMPENQNKAAAIESGVQRTNMMSMSPQGVLNVPEVGTVDETATIRANQDAALNAKIAQQDLGYAVRDATKEYIKQNGVLGQNEKEIDITQRLLKAHVLNVNKSAKAIDELNDTLTDNVDNLKDANKSSIPYKKALAGIEKAAKEVFGENLSEGFVEAHLKDFQALAKGGKAAEEAFERIGEAAGGEYLDSLNLAQQDLIQIAGLVNQLDGLNLSMGSSADFSDAFNELSALMGDASRAASFLDALGFTTSLDIIGYKEIVVGYSGVTMGPFLNPIKETRQVPIYKTTINRKSSGGSRPSKSRGGGGGGGGKGGGGGGGTDEWENSYDWLYNLLEKTNEEIRKRNKLEWSYSKLLTDRRQSAKEILANLKSQEASLKKQQAYYNQQMVGRQKEQNDIETKYKNVSKYAKYNEGTGEIEIDWSAIDKVKDSKTGEQIDDYISELEEIAGKIEGIEDSQMEIIDQLEELNNLGKDEYLSLEQRVLDALIAEEQSLIDELSEINTSVNESNQRLLNGIQKGVSDDREARSKEEALSNIQEKERRLALLQSDASGANSLEILKLQEELVKDRQSYTDTLIDKVISDLQEGNDVAATQRQRQIDLMQQQLDANVANGALWEEANEIISTALGRDGNIEGTSLEALLNKWEGTDAMSTLSREDWGKELSSQIQAGLAWWLKQNTLSSETMLEKYKNKPITFTDADGVSRTGVVGNDGSVTVGGKKYEDIYQSPDGSFRTGSPGSAVSTPTTPTTPTTPAAPVDTTKYPHGKASDTTGVIMSGSKGQQVKAIQYALNKLGYGNSGTRSVDGDYGPATKRAVTAFQKAMGLPRDGMVSSLTREQFRLKQYKSGGLNSSTGLAWLDGTKSKPEVVLNAADTKNFLQLRDMLPELIGKASGSSTNTGDNYYQIHIEVEELSDDYDVEKLATKVKKIIVNDAAHRNVNALGL